MGWHCIVPECRFQSRPAHQLIRFPQSEVLRDRWAQAITVGSGVLVQHEGRRGRPAAICSWHFGDEPLAGYREPRRFVNVERQVVEVTCCRFCLQHQDRSETVPNCGDLGRQSIESFIKQTLKISLLATNFLSDVCHECLVRVDLFKSWIQDVRRKEAEFRSMLVEAGNEELIALKKERKEHLNDSDFMSEGITEEMVEGREEPYSERVQGGQYDFKIEMLDSVDSPEEVIELETLEESNNEETTPEVPNESVEPETMEQSNNEDSTPEVPIESIEIPEPQKRKPGRPKKYNVSMRSSKRSKDPPSEKVSYKAILLRKCYICDTMLEDKPKLVCHLTEVHAAKIDYHCKQCNKSLKNVCSFNHHLSFHDEVHRHFPCSFCPMRFCSPESLKVHENNEHKTQHVLPKKYPRAQSCQCETCGKTFRDKTMLRDHVDYYHKKLAHALCSICQKSFPTKTLLMKHHVVHTGERPYKCDQCGVSFKNSTCLRNHLPKHRDDYKEWKAQQRKPPSASRPKRKRNRSVEEFVVESDEEVE